MNTRDETYKTLGENDDDGMEKRQMRGWDREEDQKVRKREHEWECREACRGWL